MESVDTIISLFQPFFDQDATPIDELFPEPTFPRIEVHLLSDLFNLSKETLKQNKALLEITSPMIVVGDLHGNLMDFLKILYYFGTPPKSRYLFLGDFVDRGRYSVNVISLILALMVKYPNDIYLIRGNHEFSHINRAYGFFDECMNTYGSDQIWNQFQEVFSWLPLAAVVGNSVFCVHGGLSPLLTSLDSIRNLPLPIPNYFNNTMISDLVWSDPVDTVRGFQLNHRGSGQIFGPDVVENFLRYNKLKIMIRGHQCTLAGFKPFANFMGITVFSSSNYCSSICNKCGVVAIKDREVLFYNIEESELGLSPSATMCLPIDGDVGLKRIFRTISRPDFHKELSPIKKSPLQGQNQNEEEEEEEDEDEFSFQTKNQQANPFNRTSSDQFIPQQQQYNSIMQMRVNMILNQQINNSNNQQNSPSNPSQTNNKEEANKDDEKEEEEKQEQQEKAEQKQEELKENQEKQEEEENQEKTEKTEEEENQEKPEKTEEEENQEKSDVENTENQQEQKSEQKLEQKLEQELEQEQNEKPEQKSEQELEQEQNEKPEQKQESEQGQIQQEQEEEPQQQKKEHDEEEEQKPKEETTQKPEEEKPQPKQEEEEKEEQPQQDDHHQPEGEEQQPEQQPLNEEQEQQNEQKHEEDQKNSEEEQQNSQQQQQQHRQEQHENDADKDLVVSNEQQTGSRTPTSKHVKLAIPIPKAPESPTSINVTFGNEPRGSHQPFLQRSRSVIDSLGGV